jgi:hypothetical protein
VDISPETQNTQDIIHRLQEAQKKEDQTVETSVLLRRGNTIIMGGDTEANYGVETEVKAIQKLPHLVIHPIYSHQTQTLMQMPRSAC